MNHHPPRSNKSVEHRGLPGLPSPRHLALYLFFILAVSFGAGVFPTNASRSLPAALTDEEKVCLNSLQDRAIGRFFDRAKESGLFDRSWIEVYGIPIHHYQRIIFGNE